MTMFSRSACLILTLFLFALPAAAQRTLSFAPYAVPQSGSIAILVREGTPAEGAFAGIDTASGGALQRAVAAANFKGRRDTQLDLPGIGGYERVLLVGIGKEAVTPRMLEDIGGIVGQAAAKSASPRFELLWSGNEVDAGAHLAFGAALGQYRFDKYRSRKDDDDAPAAGQGELVIRTPAGTAVQQVYDTEWRPVAEAVKFSRDLVTEPANALWPEVFVERTREAFEGQPNVRIEVLDVAAMQRLGMGGILAVSQGSARPPRLLVVRYDGGSSGDAPLAFVGKGITFDSGGISIKPGDGMWRMKYDMTGAASAEGRMVLSDAVWYAQQQYKPALVVDVATLTGAIVTALGDEYAGLFSRDDALAEQLRAAGVQAGEELWRMPLHPSYAKDLESPIADLRNGGARSAGAGAGAHFIGEWIQDGMPWAHLDIAGMAWREDAGTATSPKGATAFGVRLLDRFVREYHE